MSLNEFGGHGTGESRGQCGRDGECVIRNLGDSLVVGSVELLHKKRGRSSQDWLGPCARKDLNVIEKVADSG